MYEICRNPLVLMFFVDSIFLEKLPFAVGLDSLTAASLADPKTVFTKNQKSNKIKANWVMLIFLYDEINDFFGFEKFCRRKRPTCIRNAGFFEIEVQVDVHFFVVVGGLFTII